MRRACFGCRSMQWAEFAGRIRFVDVLQVRTKRALHSIGRTVALSQSGRPCHLAKFELRS